MAKGKEYKINCSLLRIVIMSKLNVGYDVQRTSGDTLPMIWETTLTYATQASRSAWLCLHPRGRLD